MTPQETHLTVCPSCSHINHGSHSFVSFLRLSISARCCRGNINARNVEHEGDRRYSHAVFTNNNTITKEGQNSIHEVLARSCSRVDPGQEASDGSKVKRLGKLGPFIPWEVRTQMKLVRAITPVVGRRCHWPTTSVGARATAFPLGRERLHLGDNVCAQATTSIPRRQRLCSGDDVCRVHS